MILVFSGTGNTLLTANHLAKLLNQKLVELRRETLATLPELETQPGEPVVWAFPVYAWGVPPVIERLIATMSPHSSVKAAVHYALITYGDDAGTIGRQWRKLLSANGLRAGAVFGVVMPNTYVCLPGFDVDSAELTERKLAAATIDIEHIAAAIASQSTTDNYIPGALPRLKSGILRSFFRKFLMSPTRFLATDACIGCGKCACQCPTANIRMTNDTPSRPVWADKCAFCLGCYHVCPRHAVAYSSTTTHKGQKKIYRLNDH